MRFVLDAEAVNALREQNHPSRRYVRQRLEIAQRLGREVVVPTVVLAELYRGAGHTKGLDALLARVLPEGLVLRDTDRGFAKLVGALLTEARMGSAHLADAHAVAAVVEEGPGVVFTGDPDDLERLASRYQVIVEPLPGAAKRSRQ